MVVIPPPKMQLTPSVGQGEKDLHVQTLVTQLAVEAFDVAVLHRLAGTDEVQIHIVLVSPVIQRLRGELGKRVVLAVGMRGCESYVST